jgi:DNA-binding NarL/FixJ family response regulator
LATTTRELHEVPAASSAITTAIVSPIRIHREYLAEMLRALDRVEVIASVRAWQDISPLTAPPQPNVMVLDAVEASACPGAVRALSRMLPESRILVLGLREMDVVACAEAGMAGYLAPEGSRRELARALGAVMSGEFECPARVAASLARRVAALATDRPADDSSQRLTGREVQILSLLSHGLSNKEIANRLCIEPATVKNHVHNLLGKLKLPRRAQAAAWYREHSLELGHYGVAKDLPGRTAALGPASA